MATLKVYSREYGGKKFKVKEKIKYNSLEKIIYASLGAGILLANLVMLNYKEDLYSLKSVQQKNENIIVVKQRENNEQKVIINDLSSYERMKTLADLLGMKAHKDSIKVVR